MFAAINFPAIDPVIFQIGPVGLRWYGLAYAVGLMLGIYYLRKLASFPPVFIEARHADDFFVWACLGVIFGGRLGYVLFYKFSYYLDYPLHILFVWQGGMSFHGGFIGVLVSGFIFTYNRKLSSLRFADMLVCVVPIGLFFGRIANFINQELVGRITDVSWGVIFPKAGSEPRHPSQLYEAALEGLILFAIVNILWRRLWFRDRPGFIAGVFVSGYGLLRGISEFYRQPDEHIGFLIYESTIGQWLSLPMILFGIYLMVSSKEEV